MKKRKVIFSVILLAINLGAVYFLKLKITLQEAATIHAFLFVVFFLTDAIQTKLSKNKSVTPLLLLSVNFSRIFICIVFLLPAILIYEKSKNTYIYNFFGIYFCLLFSKIFFNRKKHNKITG